MTIKRRRMHRSRWLCLILTLTCSAPLAAFSWWPDPWPKESGGPYPPVEGYTDRQVREAAYFSGNRSDIYFEYAPNTTGKSFLERRKLFGDSYWDRPYYHRWQSFPAIDVFYRAGSLRNENLVDGGIGWEQLISTEDISHLYVGIGGVWH